MFFGDMITNGAYKSSEEIEKEFKKAGINLNSPIVTSCGSGVTACIISFALELIGTNNVIIL